MIPRRLTRLISKHTPTTFAEVRVMLESAKIKYKYATPKWIRVDNIIFRFNPNKFLISVDEEIGK